MSMLREERKALRDEFERIYGIHLREDDEILPIIQFITEASKLAGLNTAELKKLFEEIKVSSEVVFGQYSNDYKTFLEASRQLLTASANESKLILSSAKKDLEGLPKMVNDFRTAVNQLKIPTHITVKRISFEEATMSFLWKFFSASLTIVVLALAGAMFWAHLVNEEKVRIQREYKIEQYDWLVKYYNQMKHDAPGASQKFINNNPLPNNKIN
jgi:hypothetical protein